MSSLPYAQLRVRKGRRAVKSQKVEVSESGPPLQFAPHPKMVID
jgi:hypothetical protein